MCIIVFAYKVLPTRPLLLLANRDDFYQRPTLACHAWHNNSGIIAGRDKISGGTWLAHNNQQHWAALTNYRDPKKYKSNKHSRGLIINNYLNSQQSAQAFCQQLLKQLDDYNSFNLLLADQQTLFYLSSTKKQSVELTPGIYTLSNANLETAWPKQQRLKATFTETINHDFSTDQLWSLLQDPQIVADHELPSTGVSIEIERLLSAIFIKSERYGTRCSSILHCNTQQQLELLEKVYQ